MPKEDRLKQISDKPVLSDEFLGKEENSSGEIQSFFAELTNILKKTLKSIEERDCATVADACEEIKSKADQNGFPRLYWLADSIRVHAESGEFLKCVKYFHFLSKEPSNIRTAISARQVSEMKESISEDLESEKILGKESRGFEEKEADSKYTILAIDDSGTALAMIEMRLKTSPYNLIKLKDPTQAMQRIIDEEPDVVLTDMEMPGLDGIELTQMIKSDDRTRHLPVVMFASKGSTKNIMKGFNAGVDDYIWKNDPEEIFVARIRAILAAKEIQMELYNKFVTTLNHELNNIFTIIIGRLELTTHLVPDELEAVHTNIDSISRGINKMVSIVKKMSSLDKLYETSYAGRDSMIDIHRDN